MHQNRVDSLRRVYPALFHASWIILLLAAAWQRFSPPLQPIANGDVWGFLNPALQKLLGHGFQHTNNRNFLYPGLVYGLLAIFKDFRAITILQHLLGLGTGILLLAAWCQARRGVLQPGIPQWAFDLAGVFTMAVYLFTAEPRHFEYLIRPDVICPFFAALALYSVVQFLIARKRDSHRGKAFFWGAVSVFLAALIPNLKPSFWLTSVLFTIPIWLALFDPKEPLVRRLLMVAVPIGAAAFLMFLPERRLEASDHESETFLPESLFSIHALIIRKQIADDVAHPDPSVPYSQEKLRSILGALDAGILECREKSPGHFPSLGYDADYLLYKTSFFPDVARAEGFKWDYVLGFYKYYYLRAWRKRPLEMLRKVRKQLELFYNFTCPAFCLEGFDLRRSYTGSQVSLNGAEIQKTLNLWPPAGRWQKGQAVLTSTAPMIKMNDALRLTVKLMGHAYLPGLLAFLASLPWILSKSERRTKFGLLCAMLAIGYGFNVGNTLGVALLHSLEVGRYSYVQFGTTLWTEMLTFVFLTELLLQTVNARRKISEPGAAKAETQPALCFKEPA